jgi:Tfp pilus assembly protein PilO
MIKLEPLYKKLMALSPRERLVFNVTVAFIALTLLDRLVVSPIFSRMKELNEQILEEETNIKKNLRIVSQKDKIVTESKKFETYLASSESGEEEMTALLKDLEDLASKNSVYLIDMKPAGVKEAGPVKKYIITLSLEAQMDQLAAFMYAVESSDRLSTIEKYQIEPKSRDSSVARCTMTIAKVALP